MNSSRLSYPALHLSLNPELSLRKIHLLDFEVLVPWLKNQREPFNIPRPQLQNSFTKQKNIVTIWTPFAVLLQAFNKMAFTAFLLIALYARMMSTTFSFAFNLMALLGLSSVAVSLAKDSAIRSYWSMAGGPGQKLAWDRNKTLRERNG